MDAWSGGAGEVAPVRPFRSTAFETITLGAHMATPALNLIQAMLEALNGSWPQWVSNIASVVQITGGLAAVFAILRRRCRLRNRRR